MSMDNLVGGTIWDEYSNKVADLMNNPQNMGEITEEDAKEMNARLIVADFGAESCGDAVRLYWAVDPETDTIKESKFKSFGCFASNTNVNTPNGMRKIKDLKIGDEVITWDGLNITKNTIKNVLVKKIDYKDAQVTEFTRESGGKFKLITSKDHPFWGVDHNLKIANEVNIGDEMFEMTEHELRVITNFRHQVKFKKKLSEIMKKRNKTIDHSSLPQNQKGYVCKNPELKRQKQSDSLKKKWKDPLYVKKWFYGMSKIDRNKITKLEQTFIEFFELHGIPVSYTAGKFWRNSIKGPVSPDFIVPSKKKCIEVYTKNLPIFMQDRSDSSNYIEERTEVLKSIGLEPLFISIEELNDDYDNVLRKSQHFVHNGMKVSNISNKIHKNTLDTLEQENHKLLMYDLVLEENSGGHIYFTERVASHNCGTAIASSDTMAELCKGKTVDEAVKITNIDVEMAMRDTPETPAVPPQKMHCSVMAYDVIKKAAAQYKGVDIDTFEEEIIICECARVTLSTLEETIELNNLKSIEEIIDYTKAGGFCKSCIKPGGHEEKDIYLVDLLDNNTNKKEKTFNDMTIVQKIKAIQGVVDDQIRIMLQMDGGDMELVEVKTNEDGGTDVFIKYLGACHGCASSSAGTLFGITSVLQENLAENIRVFEI